MVIIRNILAALCLVLIPIVVMGQTGPVFIQGWAGSLLGAMSNFGTSPGSVLVPGVNATIISSAASPLSTSANQLTEIASLATIATNTGASVPAGSNLIGQVSSDPCAYQAKLNVPFTTTSGNTQIVSGVSAKKIYVCSLSIIVPSAVSVSLIEGASAASCTTSTLGVIGQPPTLVGGPALGMAFPANGGLTLGNGGGTVANTATAANGLCLFQSGTAQIAGNLTYVQQ